MKHIIKISIIAVFLVALPLFMFAQPPHPNGGGAPNGSNTKVGDQPTAPIGNGTFILLAFAAAYAGRKVYELRTVKEE